MIRSGGADRPVQQRGRKGVLRYRHRGLAGAIAAAIGPEWTGIYAVMFSAGAKLRWVGATGGLVAALALNPHPAGE